MSQVLFDDGSHFCVAFRDLGTSEAIQANQYLVVDQGRAALLDPGGEPTYSRLFIEVGNHVNLSNLDYVIASHQDPDVAGSVNKWLGATGCRLVVPALWEQSIPHITRPGKLANRIRAIPDSGINLPLGKSRLQALPAHFLHSGGNFSFYDPVSKILFSGDLGSNFPPGGLDEPAPKLKGILPYMEDFHLRHMGSNRVCRLWANMVRTLEIDAIQPQHGRALVGKRAVLEFLKWLENLKCGIDLVTQDAYRVPSNGL